MLPDRLAEWIEHGSRQCAAARRRRRRCRRRCPLRRPDIMVRRSSASARACWRRRERAGRETAGGAASIRGGRSICAHPMLPSGCDAEAIATPATGSADCATPLTAAGRWRSCIGPAFRTIRGTPRRCRILRLSGCFGHLAGSARPDRLRARRDLGDECEILSMASPRNGAARHWRALMKMCW